jgi:hypothetical protein
MSTAELVVLVIAITQFVKKLFPGLKISGAWAVGLSALASVVAVFYKYLNEGIAIDIGIIALIVSVFALANGGKNLWNAVSK